MTKHGNWGPTDSGRVQQWFLTEGRTLPWRTTRTPYRTLISEFMLQQTQVSTVVPYFDRFLTRFPTILTLAEADLDEVLRLWSGLGYYRRAQALHRAAKAVAEGGGQLPTSRSELMLLPGIGRYTAGAISSLAFSEAVGAVDGNVARVLSRKFGMPAESPRGRRQIEHSADKIASECATPGRLNEALIELGALICTPKNPRCVDCPISSGCTFTNSTPSSLKVASRAKKRTQVDYVALTLVDEGKSLVGKRTSVGILANLWGPPLLLGTRRSILPALRRKGVLFKRVEPQSRRLVHQLTHLELNVEVVPVRHWPLDLSLPDYEVISVIDKSAIGDLAMSSLAHRILLPERDA